MNDDYAHSTDDLTPHEQKTFYVLCDPQGRQAVDPFDGAVTSINRPSLAEAVGEFRRDNPGRDDEADLHVVMVQHTNLGHLSEVQAPKTTEPPVKPIPEVERPTGGTVGDLRDVLETLDLVLGTTVEALGRRLTDDENPPEIQDEGMTLLVTMKYLRRLTDRGQRLIMAQRQPVAPVEVAAV